MDWPGHPWGAGALGRNYLLKQLAGNYDFVAPHYYCGANVRKLPFEDIALTENYRLLVRALRLKALLRAYNREREVYQYDTEWGMICNTPDGKEADYEDRNANISEPPCRHAGSPRLLSEMFVKPVGKFTDVEHHGQPAVLAAGMDHDLDRLPGLAGLFLEPLGLLKRCQSVRVAMINQDRWKVRGDMVNGGVLAANDFPNRQVGGLGAEGAAKALGRTAVTQVFRGTSEVQQVGYRKEDGHRLQGAAFPIYRVDGIGRTRTSACGEHQA